MICCLCAYVCVCVRAYVRERARVSVFVRAYKFLVDFCQNARLIPVEYRHHDDERFFRLLHVRKP